MPSQLVVGTPNNDCCCSNETGQAVVNVPGPPGPAGPAGPAQIFHGSGDPNTGGVLPDDVTKAAIYYDDDRVLPDFKWDVALQVWYNA